MNNLEELKPCPFCGSEAIFEEGTRHDYLHGYSIDLSLACQGCNVEINSNYGQGSYESTKGEAMKELTEQWNKRQGQ